MLDLSPDQIIDYLKRSYAAADGLWFVKTEEADGFDKALDIDEKVWQVMPKIQARMLKSFAGLDKGIEALRLCFETKLSLDGFEYTVTQKSGAFDVMVSRCPWYDKLVKSERTHLAEKIANRICSAEYQGWAKEFGAAFSFQGKKTICSGCPNCELHFEEQ